MIKKSEEIIKKKALHLIIISRINLTLVLSFTLPLPLFHDITILCLVCVLTPLPSNCVFNISFYFTWLAHMLFTSTPYSYIST